MRPGDTVWTPSGGKFEIVRVSDRDPAMLWIRQIGETRQFCMRRDQLSMMPPKKPETAAPPPLGGLFE